MIKGKGKHTMILRALKLVTALWPVFAIAFLSFIAIPEAASSPGSSSGRTTEPILRIESGGHMALIRRVIFSKDGKYLISVSDDKTIRVWDLLTGKVARTIRGEIGNDLQGGIYAADLSPDNHWLAVGGLMPFSLKDGVSSLEDSGLIRLYDFVSGDQIGSLRGQKSGSVSDLKFSPDGRYLASMGPADNTVRIWDFKNRKLVHLIKNANEPVFPNADETVFNPALAWSPNGERLAYFTSQGAQQATLWDIKNITSGKAEKITNLTGHGGIVGSVIFSPDSQYLLTSGHENSIQLWDGKSGRFLRTFLKSPQLIVGTSFSPDGKNLLTRSVPDSTEGVKSAGFPGQIWSFPEGNLITTFNQNEQNEFFLAGTISFDGQVAATADTDGKIFVWRIQDGKNVRLLEGVSQGIYSVGISANGQSIAWGTTPPCPGEDCDNALGVLDQSFNLNNLNKTELKDFSSFNRAVAKKGNMSLVPVKVGPLNRPLHLEVQTEGKPQARTPSRTIYSYSHRTFTFTPDGKIFLGGGQEGLLTLYRSNDGQPIARLTGHAGQVTAVAISSDGKWAVTGAKDQTICLWRLEGIDLSPPHPAVDWEDDLIEQQIILLKEKYPGEVIDHELITKNRNMILDEFKQILGKENLDQYIAGYRFARLPTVSPALSIFAGNNHEWVAWTPEGFFAASKDGAKLIGYHLNRGSDRNADFVEIDRLYALFYRPDLVAKKLQGGNLAEEASRFNVGKVLEGGMPPRVAFISPKSEGKFDQREIALEVEFTDLGGGVGSVLLQINGVTIGKQEDEGRGIGLIDSHRKNVLKWKQLVSLQPGENVISVTAYNKANTVESNPANVTLFVKDAISEPPTLYLLAIGINKYRDHDLSLKYAAHDAQSIYEGLKNSAGSIFKEVKVISLIDDQATTSGMEEAFKKMSSQAKSNDLFVLYLAGHGLTFDGRFYFIPQEFVYQSEDSVPKKAISQERIQQWLASIPALKSVILIDTCNSGSYAEAMARGMAEKTAIDKLTRATGRATIVASSKTQVALEGYKGHGVFTYVLLEGLKGAAYKKSGNQDGQITVNDIGQYVADEVPRITFKQFGYEQFPMQNLHGNNFPIGVVK